jgi:RHS repeat-associated protein
MLTQTDAKNQQSVYHYDALGRPDKRTDPGAGSPDTIWTWDTATNGIGQLASVSGPLGYSEVYGYDGTAGRKVSESVTAVGNTYAVNYGYDPLLGSLQTITYPTSTSGRVEVLYEYQNGFLKDVKDYNNQSTVFWQAIAQDARAHVIQEQFGNGQQTYLAFDETTGRLEGVQTGAAGGSATQNLNYSWDGAGNLLARGDGNQNLRETFQYDPLYRLQTVSLNGSQSLSMSYDSIGNIGSKSDVSSTVGGTNHGYDYTTAQSACSYTGLTSQPHAVRNAGGFVYCYDADGNMTSRTGASVTWYPYNLPQTINQTGGNYSTFYYAPDRSRYRQTSLNASVTEDRIYVGGLFEKLTSSAVGVEYRHYIVANGEKIAVKVVSSTRNDTLYLHRDHLGSTDVVTDQTGAVKVHESHDAWGRRRGSAWTGAPSAADSNTITATTHIGFTGQEELDNLGLVDLNGRVYDPLIARMLSADPYVQAPYRSQSLNRYSYTWNNPLNSTDPSGFACTGSHIADLEPGSAGCEYTSTYPGEGAQFNTPSPAARPGQSDAQPLSAQVTAGPNVNASQGALPAGAAESRALAEVSITASRDPASRSELFLRGLIHVAEVALPGYYFANRAYELARTGHPWWALIYGVASVTDVALTVVTAGAAEGALSAVRGGFVAEAAFAADNAAQAARGVGAIVGGGAKLENLTASEILRIQNAANRTGTKITVVGSRASGTSHALSDWDYVVPEGTANRIIHSIKSSVPEGPRGLGEPRNQDFFKSGVDPTSPFITFTPQ